MNTTECVLFIADEGRRHVLTHTLNFSGLPENVNPLTLQTYAKLILLIEKLLGFVSYLKLLHRKFIQLDETLDVKVTNKVRYSCDFKTYYNLVVIQTYMKTRGGRVK